MHQAQSADGVLWFSLTNISLHINFIIQFSGCLIADITSQFLFCWARGSCDTSGSGNASDARTSRSVSGTCTPTRDDVVGSSIKTSYGGKLPSLFNWRPYCFTRTSSVSTYCFFVGSLQTRDWGWEWVHVRHCFFIGSTATSARAFISGAGSSIVEISCVMLVLLKQYRVSLPLVQPHQLYVQ